MTRGLGKRWVWSLLPLSRTSWGNQEIPDDGSPPGQTIEVRCAVGRGQRVYLRSDETKPCPWMLLAGWRAYVPTEADIVLLRRCYPESDPHRPAWHIIKRDLVLAGHDSHKLSKMEAPVLLGLLERARSGREGPPSKRSGSANLTAIAAGLRQVAARMEGETPVHTRSRAWYEQEERLWQNRCEAARLFLAAVEAGAYAGDTGLSELIEQTKLETDRDTVGNWQEHVRCYRFNIIGAVVEEWMPKRWPDSMIGSAAGPAEGEDYNEHRWYAANLRILANKVEAVWAISQPSSYGGEDNAASTNPPGTGTATPISRGMRDKVFISYSHKDTKFRDELLTHLKPMVRNRLCSVWSDESIRPGKKWFSEIKAAIASAKVAVLLVTTDFLASDFIQKHELSPLLDEAARGSVAIIWVPVRACAYASTMLKDIQAVIPPDNPLARMKKADRDSAWTTVCQAIKAAMDGPSL